MSNESDDDGSTIDRRTLLKRSAGTAAAIAGLGAITGSAAAWADLEAHFRGCSEVWILAGEKDFKCQDPDGESYVRPKNPNNECPLVVDVVVATGSGIDCRPVEFVDEAATRIPGQFDDRPVIKYSVSGGEKILGIIGLSPSRTPLCSDLRVNTNKCTQTPNTPSIFDSDCMPMNEECDEPPEPDSDNGKPGGPPNGRGPPWSR